MKPDPSKLFVDPDIKRASTLPTDFYTDPELFSESASSVLARSWQLVCAEDSLKDLTAFPFQLLPGILDEPLLLSQDGEIWHCLSNVCTHRGNLLVTEAGCPNKLRCRYHGRLFEADGRFISMPEFEEAEAFPSSADHLPALPLHRFCGHYFTSISPLMGFDELMAPVLQRLDWFDWDGLVPVEELAADYRVKAHWALYCDNYLEGFHIPFVHQGLNKVIDYGSYSTETFPWCNLQLGLAREGEACFDLPESSADFGKKVAAYYWWVFPNMMVNVYPWGVSLNFVIPTGQDSCTVLFRSLALPGAELQDRHDLHKVELEDEEVVQSVQQGVQSRLYRRGRFSPTMEQGVHHFHRLLSTVMIS